ncbi:MAG TPA: DUF3341 domain-containing protein [Minicystis sp.]|nr:DUF3341 domain-containing protein [Minicystis sp.]
MRAGLVAEFATAEDLARAIRGMRKKGYRDLDAFTPFPVRDVEDALGLRRSMLTWLALPFAVAGGLAAYLIQFGTNARDYPLDVGGRPLHSVAAFVPITFEMTVLCCGLAALVILLALCGLPELYSPIFDVPGFERASVDRFFLGVDERDPLFDRDRGERELVELGALSVAFAARRPL